MVLVWILVNNLTNVHNLMMIGLYSFMFISSGTSNFISFALSDILFPSVVYLNIICIFPFFFIQFHNLSQVVELSLLYFINQYHPLVILPLPFHFFHIFFVILFGYCTPDLVCYKNTIQVVNLMLSRIHILITLHQAK